MPQCSQNKQKLDRICISKEKTGKKNLKSNKGKWDFTYKRIIIKIMTMIIIIISWHFAAEKVSWKITECLENLRERKAMPT